MSTVLRTRNLRIVIYPKDHSPPHVHVLGPNAEAKFLIGTWECVRARGFSERDLMRIQQFLSDKTEMLLEVWNENQDT